MITREQALEIAKLHVAEKGWAWVEPVHVNHGGLQFHVMTNANHRGGNVNVHVSAEDGRVVSSAFARR